ncbi:hypothetical protein OSB04_001851 [Centaurea solstitialis]|uniref:Transducin/WD40 repeat-like superfamily protein n=1 Tax=Centaurea solstitialis TaxID=347529 RepID=A0AA38U3H2_9ASTR|nr:hypothetical protein OSB04_001851 [Centaurea solstitialis]
MAEASVEDTTNATAAGRSDVRRLRGHKAIATCCIASRDRPGLIATSGEDGSVCWFDMRCKDLLHIMDVAENPISSLCFKSGNNPYWLLAFPDDAGNEDIIYASSENEVKVFDVHMVISLDIQTSVDVLEKVICSMLIHRDCNTEFILQLASWKPLESYNYNKEEINQITCNSKSSFLAAADDAGDIKIIDIRQKCLYKTLRAAHESVSLNQPPDVSPYSFLALFLFTFAVITGGLDSKLIMWDFSKGGPSNFMDLGKPDLESGDNAAQCFNPAFVHAIAVPEVDMLEKLDKICVVARGDGVVDVINIESEFSAASSRGSSKPRKGGQSRSNGNASSRDSENQDQNRRTRLRLDYSSGGHTAAVSCVFFEPDQTCDNNEFLTFEHKSEQKIMVIYVCGQVNWLCTTPTDSDNLVVCDTSKVVKVYTVA